MVAFPLSPVPAGYVGCNWLGATQPRQGIFYVGGTAPVVKLLGAGATAYYVLNYDGTTVSSGSVGAGVTTVTPTAPGGGWQPGWYRIYFTGPVTDALYGNSYAITNFVVLRNNAHFIPTPAGNLEPPGSFNLSESADPISKGVLGIGTSRIIIQHAEDPTNVALSPDRLDLGVLLAQTSADYWTDPGATYLDPARTRYLWCAFPNGTVDSLVLPPTSGAVYLTCYCKDGTIDGSKVFVRLEAGSVSGNKITVRFPDAVTIVETYDNQANATAAATAINAASTRIKVFTGADGAITGATQAATAIGKNYFNGVSLVVSTLYAEGVTRYEGPSNEPTASAEIAHQMRLFQAAVHAGNASAKAIGPCPVDINSLGPWRNFLNAGGGTYCDEFSFHAYGFCTNGDLNLGRHILDTFFAMLAEYGLQTKVCWQTESTQAMNAVYGVHHPRRARLTLLQTLLLEQYGIARERNNPWYDRGHGFWDFPTFWENEDGSVQPQAAMARTLAEETWGQTHAETLSFGGLADHIFFGSRYNGPSSSTVVLMATSYMVGATVTIQTTATSVTIVDAFGVEGVRNPIAGRITIPVREVPTYLRLARTDTCSVVSVNDWTAAYGDADDVAINMTPSVGVDTVRGLVGGFAVGYSPPDGIYHTSGTVPQTVQLKSDAQFYRLDRLILWGGSAWQLDSTPLVFQLQTTTDLITWTTAVSADYSAGVTAFQAGSSSTNIGCQWETYWNEQWIYDVPIPGSPVAIAARLVVTATSFGGEPTAACVAAGGQGDGNQHLVLQRISLIGTPVANPADTTPYLSCRTVGRG